MCVCVCVCVCVAIILEGLERQFEGAMLVEEEEIGRRMRDR